LNRCRFSTESSFAKATIPSASHLFGMRYGCAFLRTVNLFAARSGKKFLAAQQAVTSRLQHSCAT
jgi:hypothetical protein